ncbi:MAG: hypothetical protein DCC59_03810 [Chloroflexi bacterium]|nr:hypothetical protein [Anaerolineales bacterium]MDL1920001.1 hypothetical protein [Chloroflexi bacterium CFX5]NUQ59138.1 hypothetical protein [Anaerolineales bacterium]RIK54495.1 MAG: hypothetical protein DCC59_03810 [Chloroflexota bacterium]
MKSYRMLFIFMSILLAVSLACGGQGEPTPNPTMPPLPTNPPPPTAVPAQPTQAPAQPTQAQQQPSSNGMVTFVDQNNLLAFDLPGDWTYEHTDHGDAIYSDVLAYTDTFTSPDSVAKIESLVMFANEGVTVNNSTSQAVALDILNTYYSSTGTNNGDIRIKSDQIMKDGSERFEWISKGGNYTGVSYFEVRGSDKRTWLMWTLWWSNSADQSILDTIENVIASYYVP